MKLLKTLFIGALAVATVFASAQGFGGGGQRGGMGRWGGNSPLMLLIREDVKEELKMTEEQTGKFKKIGEDIREKFKDDIAAAKGDRTKGQEIFKKVGDATTEAITKDLATVLKPEQVARLKQIELQQLGMGALSKEEVAKDLALTAAQKEKIKGLSDDLAKDLEDLRKDQPKGKFDPNIFKKQVEARTATFEKATGVLDDTQKATWKKLTGEKFEMKLFGKGA